MNRSDFKLYAITDRTHLCGQTLAEAVAQAIEGGATMVQVREKGLSAADYEALATEIQTVCSSYGVPLVVNDSLAVARAIGAGVHLGASDGDIAEARQVLGPDAIIGATAKTVAQAQAAERAGASYLGSGAVFGSATKADATPMPLSRFAEICRAVSIPVVAIGGITADNARQLAGTGLAGLCAVSAIFAQADIKQAAMRLRALADEVVQ